MRSPNSGLHPAEAFALGALQGPAELLPISSSAHTTTIPWLLGWRYGELEPEVRKSFEVALHAAGAVALLASLGREIAVEIDRRRALLIAAASAPPAITGYAFERQIESRLGTPATIAAGLVAGSAVMLLADRAPARRGSSDAGVRDGMWLGVAQSAALIPGVSRAGATLSAARLRGFRNSEARRLSEQVGFPVLVGASLLKAIHLRERGLEKESAPAFAAGAMASFVSTLICVRLRRRARSSQRLAAYAIYRIALAGLILIRLWRGSTAGR